MNTIPVGKTIAFAYQFTLENLGAIIGLIWLPTVAITVGGFFADTTYSATVNAAVQGGQTAVAQQAMMSLLAWYFLSLLLSAMAATAVTRQALGLRKGPAFISFALGLPEFRVFGAEILLLLVLIVMALPCLLIVITVAAAPALGSLASILALAGAGSIFFVLVRLGFLVLPATVAENKIGLVRSWMLTRNNFWRVVGVGACTLGPILVILAAGEYFILGPDALNLGFDPNASAAEQTRLAMEQQRITIQHLPMLLGLSLLIAPFYFGLLLAPAAYAYRVLTDAKPVV